MTQDDLVFSRLSFLDLVSEGVFDTALPAKDPNDLPVLNFEAHKELHLEYNGAIIPLCHDDYSENSFA